MSEDDFWDNDVCPSSPEDDRGPHIVTDGRTCDECGASVTLD